MAKIPRKVRNSDIKKRNSDIKVGNSEIKVGIIKKIIISGPSTLPYNSADFLGVTYLKLKLPTDRELCFRWKKN